MIYIISFFISLSLVLNLQAQTHYFKSLRDFLKTVQTNNLSLKIKFYDLQLAQEDKNLTYLQRTIPNYRTVLNKRKLSAVSTSKNVNFNQEFNWTPFFTTNTQLSAGLESVQNFEFSELSSSPNGLSSLTNTSSLNRWTSRYFVSVKQPLLRDGLIGGQNLIIKQHDKHIQLSQIQYQKELETVLQQAINLFLHYTHQKKLIESLKKQIKNNQEIERFQQKKLKTGTIEQQDIYKANIALLNNQNQLEKQQHQLQSIEMDILNLLNLKESGRIKFSKSISKITLKQPHSFKNILSKTLSVDLSLKSIKTQLELNKTNLAATKKSVYPKLDLEVKLFKGGREDDLFSSYKRGLNGRFEYFINGTFEIPLSGYYSSAKKFKHQIQQTKIQKQKHVHLIRSNLRNLLSHFKLNQKQIRTYQKIYTLNQKHHKILHKKYLQGQINYVDYINSQNNLQQSLNSLIQTSLSLQLNVVEMQKISGDILNQYKI